MAATPSTNNQIENWTNASITRHYVSSKNKNILKIILYIVHDEWVYATLAHKNIWTLIVGQFYVKSF